MSRLSDTNQQITADIIKLLKAGKPLPWRLPITDKNTGASANITKECGNFRSRQDYTGINVLILAMAAYRRGFSARWWATERQWAMFDATVKSGEIGTGIVFYGSRSVVNEDGDDDKEPFWHWYTVYNIEQVNAPHLDRYRVGHPAAQLDKPEMDERYTTADHMIEKTGAKIVHGSRRRNGKYNTTTDTIMMPDKARCDLPYYYSVVFHELVHWSGHTKRLKRNLTGLFGSTEYAYEELVAEMGSAFTAARLGIPTVPKEHTAAYIRNWLTCMNDDERFVIDAAKAASRASNYLMKRNVKPNGTTTDRSAAARKAWETRRTKSIELEYDKLSTQ